MKDESRFPTECSSVCVDNSCPVHGITAERNGVTLDLNHYRRMPVKLFEVRDRATFMPVMAVKLFSAPIAGYVQGIVEDAPRGRERWLLRRAGYSEGQITDPTE